MKTLLERAKPELRQAMESFRELSPNTTKRIERQLSENRCVIDLTYDCILGIKMIVRDNDMKFDMNNPWEYFEDHK
jgi:hypothetical protein